MIFHVLNASLLNQGVGGSDVEWIWWDYSQQKMFVAVTSNSPLCTCWGLFEVTLMNILGLELNSLKLKPMKLSRKLDRAYRARRIDMRFITWQRPQTQF